MDDELTESLRHDQPYKDALKLVMARGFFNLAKESVTRSTLQAFTKADEPENVLVGKIVEYRAVLRHIDYLANVVDHSITHSERDIT